MSKDAYYSRTEVSNSDLTALQKQLYPEKAFTGDPTYAFKMGTLVDAMITEPEKLDPITRAIDDYRYDRSEWDWGKKMKKAFDDECDRNMFLKFVKDNSDCQKVMVNQGQEFEYNGFKFQLDTRCKWDFWMDAPNFGGDLKTTAATTYDQFLACIDLFDWDRSRAWYMDIAGSDKDFIVAISKETQQIFMKPITRGDEIYTRGKEKYLELAFQYWKLYM